MRRLLLLSILLLLASFGVAQAQPAQTGELLVYNVWVRPTAAAPTEGATPEPPLPGTTTSAYMTIENTTGRYFQLVGIETDFDEMSMIHETTIDDAGVARMKMVGTLNIPAGETVQLAPAGYHAMLMNVTRDIYRGEAERLALTFADSDGATFTMAVGAVVTDFPPEEDTLIAANAVAEFNDAGSLDVSLILDNRGDQADTLTVATSGFGQAEFQVPLPRHIATTSSLEIPAQAQITFGYDAIMRFSDLPIASIASIEAFPLTLTFASGKVITVAVPVITGEAE